MPAEGMKNGGCYGSSELEIVVPGACWRRIFPWKRRLGRKRRKSLTSCSQSSRPLPISGMPYAVSSALRFEAYLEPSIELVKAGLHPTGDVSPTPILERGDGDSQFEFDGILGLKVTTAVAADDF